MSTRAATPGGGPTVSDALVDLRVPDPEGAWQALRLYWELGRPRLGIPFERVDGAWSMRIPRPATVDRFEYLLVASSTDGEDLWLLDPFNPVRAGGPFGDKSVVELPGYAPPVWLCAPPAPTGSAREVRVRSNRLRRSLQVTLWTSAGHAGHDELPLLVVHDGPEYAVHASLLAYLDRRVHDGAIPPLHAALIGPGRRDEEYAANPAYARALAEEILPAVSARLRVFDDSRARVGVGASLGGLALLHAQLQYPSLFGGLFLQSSSFLRGGIDGHERWLSRYDHVVRFVDALVSQRTATRQGVAVTLTCGLAEENLQSNRDVHRALLESGHDATLVEVRDAHNWTAWRDSLDPHLGDLLRGLWGSRRAQG